MKMFGRHNHNWAVLSDTVVSSTIEKMIESGRAGSIRGMPDSFFEKMHVVILTCAECGQIKEVVNRVK
jgi:hypothetical protein